MGNSAMPFESPATPVPQSPPSGAAQNYSGAARRGWEHEHAFISKSLVIMGEITGAESLYIDGRVEGKIELPANSVSIGRNGVVTSQVHAHDIAVRGELHGDVTAEDKIEIRSGGSLTGDVVSKRVTIEDGAYFKGSIDMRRADPKAHVEVEATAAKAEVEEHPPDD